MALRIIRKSSSQSQVELIKGSTEAKPLFSLALFFSTPAELEAVKALTSHPILASAELLLYRTQAYEEAAPGQAVRSQLPAMTQTAKLINESKTASWSLRFRTIVQEASSPYCLFAPFVPETSQLEKIPGLIQVLQQDPAVGLAGPALATETVLLAAGQEVAHRLPPHTIAYDSFEQNYSPEQIFYLYRALPLSLWKQLAPETVQVPGVPLALAAIRREAYLSLAWTDQDWSLPWLAADLALGLRQKQYRLALGAQVLTLDGGQQEWLEAGPMPASFQEKWQQSLRPVLYEIYRQHGWKQVGNRFQEPLSPSRIQAYLAQKG